MSQNLFFVVVLAVGGYHSALSIDYVELEAKDVKALTEQNRPIWNLKMKIGDSTDAFSLYGFQPKDTMKPGLMDIRATVKFIKAGGNVPAAWVNNEYDIKGEGLVQKEKVLAPKAKKKSGKFTIQKGSIGRFSTTSHGSTPVPDSGADNMSLFLDDAAATISKALNDNILNAKIF